MMKAASLLGRILALCFALELMDVPAACPDEWQPRAASTALAFSAMVSDTASTRLLAPAHLDPMGQDCGCPCHQTFGSKAVQALPPPARLCEVPPLGRRSSSPPPPNDLRHPPQNLT